MKATIVIDEDVQNIVRLFAPEEKIFQNNRSSYSVAEQDGKAVFEVLAKDATALRATLGSITKILSCYYQVKNEKTN